MKWAAHRSAGIHAAPGVDCAQFHWHGTATGANEGVAHGPLLTERSAVGHRAYGMTMADAWLMHIAW